MKLSKWMDGVIQDLNEAGSLLLLNEVLPKITNKEAIDKIATSWMDVKGYSITLTITLNNSEKVISITFNPYEDYSEDIAKQFDEQYEAGRTE